MLQNRKFEGQEVVALVLVLHYLEERDYIVSRAAAKWATGVSKASINVRVGVQHKCHFVMAPLYWMLTQ